MNEDFGFRGEAPDYNGYPPVTEVDRENGETVEYGVRWVHYCASSGVEESIKEINPRELALFMMLQALAVSVNDLNHRLTEIENRLAGGHKGNEKR